MKGLTNGPNVIKLPKWLDSIKANIRQEKLSKKVKEINTEGKYFILAEGLNQQISKGLSESQNSKDLRRTLEDDFHILAKGGKIESHRLTLELNGGQIHSFVVVYGSVASFEANIDRLNKTLEQVEFDAPEITDQEIESLVIKTEHFNQSLSLCTDTHWWTNSISFTCSITFLVQIPILGNCLVFTKLKEIK